MTDWNKDAPIGFHAIHPDVSLNFQANRWLSWIGIEARAELLALAERANTYPEWIDGYLALAERARASGRSLAHAYYTRAAEFFMAPRDPRRASTRTTFVTTLRAAYGVTVSHVPYGKSSLPSFDLRPAREVGAPIVAFGGFDSYIEEFLPALTAIAAHGRRVIAFEGPGQGGALEESGLPMIAEWERPVAAVLDHYRLAGVTAVGISLGGGLVIRAAAFEPRIARAIAYNILDDELEVVARAVSPRAAPVVRALAWSRQRFLIDRVAGLRARRSPLASWGAQQGMHVTGTRTPYEFLRAASLVNTRGISQMVTADVLLLAGADDHYVPLHQLYRQAANLTHARSVTTRVFSAAEHASSHCQIGNIGLAIRTMNDWLDAIEPRAQVSRPEPQRLHA